MCDACEYPLSSTPTTSAVVGRRALLRRAGIGGAAAAAATLVLPDGIAGALGPPFESVQLGEDHLAAVVPAVSAAVPAAAPSAERRRSSGRVSAPTIVSRAEWGADESIRTAERGFAPDPQVRDPSHRQRQQTAQARADRPGHVPLPRQGSGLLRRRVQLRHRPSRHHLRGPLVAPLRLGRDAGRGGRLRVRGGRRPLARRQRRQLRGRPHRRLHEGQTHHGSDRSAHPPAVLEGVDAPDRRAGRGGVHLDLRRAPPVPEHRRPPPDGRDRVPGARALRPARWIRQEVARRAGRFPDNTINMAQALRWTEGSPLAGSPGARRRGPWPPVRVRSTRPAPSSRGTGCSPATGRS